MSLSELFLLRIRFNEKGEGFLRNSLNGFLVFFDDDADALVPAPNGGSAVVADGEGSKLGSKFSKLVPVEGRFCSVALMGRLWCRCHRGYLRLGA